MRTSIVFIEEQVDPITGGSFQVLDSKNLDRDQAAIEQNGQQKDVRRGVMLGIRANCHLLA